MHLPQIVVCTVGAFSIACGGGSTGSPDATPASDPDAQAATSCTSHSLPRELDIQVGDRTRRTLLAGPTDLPETPLALVLNFHGYSDSPEKQEQFSLMSEHALAAGYVVAYPEGTGLIKGWNAGACCGTAASDGIDDVAFAEALIDQIADVACIDKSRVYSIGYSNGGFLSHRLACELSDKIAGIAAVAGVIGIDDCEPARIIPVMQFHGVSDLIVPYAGSIGLGFPSVDETMEGWRLRNGCSDAEPEVSLSQGDTTCLAWVDCDQPVELCTIEGGGHTWPGGATPVTRGLTSTDIDANMLLMSFFGE